MNYPSLLLCCALWVAVDCAERFGCGVMPFDQEVIMDMHNWARTAIEKGTYPGQNRGKYIKKLKYDTRLAMEAQRVSEICVAGHVKINDDRWSVGQNLHIKYSAAPKSGNGKWPDAINAWLDEAHYYTHGDLYTDKNRNFTQIIWANTEYVGCGYTQCLDTRASLPAYFQLYICYYGPTGNVPGEYPYQLAWKKSRTNVEDLSRATYPECEKGESTSLRSY